MPTVIQSDKIAMSHLGAAATFGLQVPAYLEGVYAAAYSLRQLRQAYAGPVLRVRNATNNAEGDVAFAGFALRTTSVVTITVAGSSGYNVGQTMTLATFAGAANVQVVKWYDQSGNGRDMAPLGGTAAAQPSLMVAGVVNLVGGLPIVACDGADDNLLLTYTRPAVHSILWAGVTGTTTAGTVVSGYRSPSGSWAHEINASLGPGRHINNGSAVGDSVLDLNAIRVYAAKFNGATSAMFVDGAEVATGDAGSFFSLDLRLGMNSASAKFATKYREVLMYPDATPDLAAISQKVLAYYGM